MAGETEIALGNGSTASPRARPHLHRPAPGWVGRAVPAGAACALGQEVVWEIASKVGGGVMLGPILIVMITVAVMEGVAYSAHRWIMHGPLGWGWHKSHHEHDHEGAFEKNDLYAVVFSALSIALFALGSRWWPALWWIAVGMTVYGLIYFVVHDGLVHQRWPFRAVPKRGYLRRLYQAHRLHHAVEGRDDCVSFGFVYAPRVDALKARLAASGVLARRQSRHRDAWHPDAQDG